MDRADVVICESSEESCAGVRNVQRVLKEVIEATSVEHIRECVSVVVGI